MSVVRIIRSRLGLDKLVGNTKRIFSTRATACANGTTGNASDISTEKFFSFNDHKHAFKEKTTLELWRAVSVLQVCSLDIFVKHNLKILEVMQRYIPKALFSMMVRPTFYNQFVADRSILPDYVSRLGQAGIRPILAVSIEETADTSKDSEKTLAKKNFETLMDCVRLTSELKTSYPMMQLKITAFISKELLKTVSQLATDNILTPHMIYQQMCNPDDLKDISQLTPSQKEELSRGLSCLYRIGELSLEKNVRILVDAEYTFINPALRLLSMAMALAFNKSTPHVWYTYQCYLKNTRQILKEDTEFTQRSSVCFGAKVVRGAYITSESELAAQQGVPSPICDSYEDTNVNYDTCVEAILQLVKERTDNTAVIIATHNESSVRTAIRRMNQLDLDTDRCQIFFGQLMGMCDQVTYTLGQHGYKVCKSIPYGEMDEVLPYLSRRVTENTSVFQNVRKEKRLLRQELRSRLSLYPK